MSFKIKKEVLKRALTYVGITDSALIAHKRTRFAVNAVHVELKIPDEQNEIKMMFNVRECL